MVRTGRHSATLIYRQVALLGAALVLVVVTALANTGVARADTIVNRWAWNTQVRNFYYITTDGTTPYGAAESGNQPGRTFTSTSSGNYSDPDHRCATSGIGCVEWNLKLDSGYCLGAANDNINVDIKPCDASGTVWVLMSIIHNGITNDEWLNARASDNTGQDLFLTGDNVLGDRVVLDCWRCGIGNEKILQEWAFTPR